MVDQPMVVHLPRMSSMMTAEFELWRDDWELGVMQRERNMLSIDSDRKVAVSNLVWLIVRTVKCTGLDSSRIRMVLWAKRGSVRERS